ncbi:unnamed protein product [Mytilus coruscus]|uniref:Uncharacterized protein n=1 Tax=Mytilus coruscus TaxID=42192 RepID=A0A6J8CZ89_MYTCO|nr:unnamed protein product [Mytilus coruscus]
MSVNKLFKYIRRPLKHPLFKTLYLKPVILADSKGSYLQSEIVTQYEREIKWYFKKGASIKEARIFLQQNIQSIIQEFGDLSLYVWLGTCNLTSKSIKGRIAITTFNRNQVIESILQEVELIIELFNKYPKSKLTFLETPLYSIVEWNRNKRHPDITEFYEQDIELEEQLVQLNKQIKLINNRVGSYSPKFSSDLACNTKYKKGLCHNKLTKRHHHNFNLYKDGIHPKKLLAVTWLKKITEQILKDCWH